MLMSDLTTAGQVARQQHGHIADAGYTNVWINTELQSADTLNIQTPPRSPAVQTIPASPITYSSMVTEDLGPGGTGSFSASTSCCWWNVPAILSELRPGQASE